MINQLFKRRYIEHFQWKMEIYIHFLLKIKKNKFKKGTLPKNVRNMDDESQVKINMVLKNLLEI